jgi:hypothetical protein
MKRLGLPLSRETYLTLDRWELNPELGPEEEAALPPQFRKDSDEGIRWCRWCGAMVVPEIDHGVRTDDWIHIEDVGEPGARVSAVSNSPCIANRSARATGAHLKSAPNALVALVESQKSASPQGASQPQPPAQEPLPPAGT